jgi:hypothetical protein
MDEHRDRYGALAGGKIEPQPNRAVGTRQRHVFDRVHGDFAIRLVEIGVVALACRTRFLDADIGGIGQRHPRRFQFVEDGLQSRIHG